MDPILDVRGRLQIGWKLKAAFLVTLIPDGQFISIPVRDLQPITRSIAKQKQRIP